MTALYVCDRLPTSSLAIRSSTDRPLLSAQRSDVRSHRARADLVSLTLTMLFDVVVVVVVVVVLLFATPTSYLFTYDLRYDTLITYFS